MIRPLDQFNFHHALEDTRGDALVIFTAPRCGACQMLLTALEEHAQDHVDVRMFEIDVQQDMALAREFDVFHLPALFFYVDGRYHGEIQCEARPDKIEQALAQARLKPAAEAP